MDMSLNNLRVFIRVVELGSFTAAAGVLNITQPAVSRTIQGLEESFGVKLFDRHTRRLSLTPAGEELCEIARRMTGEIDRAFSDFEDFLEGRRGRITIATLPSIAGTLFPATLRKFRQQHPDVSVQVKDSSEQPVLDEVLRGAVDFAVTMEPTAGHEVRFQPLLMDRLVLVSDGRERMTEDGSTPWSIFRDKPFIALHRGSSIRRMTDEAFSRVGMPVSPSHECSHPVTVVSLVAAGMGVTALTQFSVATLPHTPGVICTPLEPPHIGRQIGVATLTGRSLSPAASSFLKILKTDVALLR